MKKRNIFAAAVVLGLLLALMVGLGASAHNPEVQQPPPQGRQPAAPAGTEAPTDLFPPQLPAGAPEPMGVQAVDATVGHSFSYQGVLEEDGQPVTGDREMIFQLHVSDACTAPIGSDITLTVPVNEGLFQADLDFPHSTFNGQALWLETTVEGTSIGCQPLQTAPYAMSLRPGAVVSGTDALMFHVQFGWDEDSGEGLFGARLAQSLFFAGSGVYGYTNVPGYGVVGVGEYDGGATIGVGGISSSPGGYGVSGQATHTDTVNYGIHGTTSSPRGYGGYFRNGGGEGTEGVAVMGLSASGSTSDVPSSYYDAGGEFYGPNGVIGAASDDRSDGYGVFGLAQGTSGRGVFGSAITTTGTTYGVYGQSASEDGVGVYGQSTDTTGDPNTPAGVYGRTSSSDGFPVVGMHPGYDVSDIGTWAEPAGLFAGQNGLVALTEDSGYIAVIGDNRDTSSGYGVGGYTANPTQNYGLYTTDNLYSANYNLAGAVMQVVQNGGDQDLEAGDVVVFSGIGAPLEEGGTPMIQVAKATSANDTGVAGVVHSHYTIELITGNIGREDAVTDIEETPEKPVAPGDYLLVVVQGPVQVKVSALSGAIEPGDLLSSAGEAGHAAKAAELTVDGVTIAPPGTVFGKALEALDEGDGLVYVFVTLH